MGVSEYEQDAVYSPNLSHDLDIACCNGEFSDFRIRKQYKSMFSRCAVCEHETIF